MTDSEERPAPARKNLVLVICCTAVLMANLDTTALNVALPSISRELHTSVSGAQWTAAAYTVVMACLLMLSGSLGDRFGRRTVFLIGLIIFAAGSLACSLAPSLGWLVAFRMLQAVGGSMLNPVAMSIITNVFTEPRERARAIGVWSGTTGISMAAGPVVGGLLVDAVGWEAIFWINVPIALAAFALTVRYVPQSRAETPRRFDPIGQLLVIGILGPLVFAIIEAPQRGWGSPVTLGCVAAVVACLLGLLSYEPRHAEPLIDVRVFRSPPFSGAIAIAVLAYVGMGGFLFLNTFYLQEVRGDRPFIAGLELLPMAAAMLIAGPLSGRATGQLGHRWTLTFGGVVATAAALWLSFTFDSGGQLALLTGYALFGIGIGVLNTPISDLAIAGLPREQAGVAASFATTSRQIGQTLGVAIIGSVMASWPNALASVDAFRTPARISWLILTAAVLLALIVARRTAPGLVKTRAAQHSWRS